jgi:hypothetical protein
VAAENVALFRVLESARHAQSRLIFGTCAPVFLNG